MGCVKKLRQVNYFRFRLRSAFANWMRPMGEIFPKQFIENNNSIVHLHTKLM